MSVQFTAGPHRVVTDEPCDQSELPKHPLGFTLPEGCKPVAKDDPLVYDAGRLLGGWQPVTVTHTIYADAYPDHGNIVLGEN